MDAKTLQRLVPKWVIRKLATIVTQHGRAENSATIGAQMDGQELCKDWYDGPLILSLGMISAVNPT
jgi:hypothetical protein